MADERLTEEALGRVVRIDRNYFVPSVKLTKSTEIVRSMSSSKGEVDPAGKNISATLLMLTELRRSAVTGYFHVQTAEPFRSAVALWEQAKG